MSEPIIAVDSVRVSYDDRTVLTDVSLSVDPGSFVGLVGPNGAGKTTLLQTINGVTTPEDGSVRIDGEPVHDRSARSVAKRVATVPQESASAFSFPVRKVVAMGRHPHRSRFDRTARTTAVSRAMNRTGVERLAERAMDTLSGGERQRVLLARAIAQETPALVLDEPTASLDISHQVRTLGLVSALVADGKGVIAAIHDLDLAARFCDVVYVLTDGEVIDSGPPATVFTPETIKSAYGESIAVHVHENPVTNTPSITTVDDRPADTH